jgi:hypothetical protein
MAHPDRTPRQGFSFIEAWLASATEGKYVPQQLQLLAS